MIFKTYKILNDFKQNNNSVIMLLMIAVNIFKTNKIKSISKLNLYKNLPLNKLLIYSKSNSFTLTCTSFKYFSSQQCPLLQTFCNCDDVSRKLSCVYSRTGKRKEHVVMAECDMTLVLLLKKKKEKKLNCQNLNRFKNVPNSKIQRASNVDYPRSSFFI